MNNAQTGTTAESASKIMGRACITIEEVLELFPEARGWVNPADYQQVPFPAGTLYYLAEQKWDYILFPAIPCKLQHGFLSVEMIEGVFREKFPEVNVSTISYESSVNLFAPTDKPVNYKPLYRISAYYLNNHFKPQKWYLMTGHALKLGQRPLHKIIGNAPDKIELSIVYIYAWLLYWRLRQRSLFTGRPFPCSDYYARDKSKAEVVLKFGDAEIAIGQRDKRLDSQLSIVRSIICPENGQNQKTKNPG